VQGQRHNLTLAEAEAEDSKDQALGGLLDRLGGAIEGKTVSIMPTEVRVWVVAAAGWVCT
jgi:hypothetical protein